MSEKKPFPPPPFINNRAQPAKDTSATLQGDPFPTQPPIGHETTEPDPRMDDDDVRLIFAQFLRPDQRMNTGLLKFILNYVSNRNTAQAAREAGITNGSYWRQKPEIHACIEAITQRMVIKHGYDSHEVIESAKEIATIDPIEFQNPDGTFKTHLSEIRAEARRAIKKFKCRNIFGEDVNGMKMVTGQLIEVEMWDKLKGIELLGSEKNIFKKTTVVQHDVTNNMKDVLLESGNRAEERIRLMAAREVKDEGEASYSDSNGSGDGVSVGESGGSGAGDRSSEV